MHRFTVGDQVRIDIPEESDPDYERYHGIQGTVVEVLEDDAGKLCSDEREGFIFRIEIDSGENFDCRWRDLRPL